MSSTRFATGKIAIAECDRCGFRYKLKALRKLVINGSEVNLKVCDSCWEPDHPQLHLGDYPVYDPQAIRDPRPDSAGYAQSRALHTTFVGYTISSSVGSVTVTIT